MKNLKELIEKHRNLIIILGMTLFFFVGLILHIIPDLQFLARLLTPFFLFGMGFFVLAVIIFPVKRDFAIWIIGAYAFTLGVEIAGVKTGLIFGTYWYGETLGFQLFDVPLVIGFNWVLIMLGINSLIKKIAGPEFNTGKIVLCTSIAALGCVIFDIALEPVAIRLDYWQWDKGIIPVHNYIGWFITGSIVSFPFYKIKTGTPSTIPFAYVVIQFIFFIILQMTLL